MSNNVTTVKCIRLQGSVSLNSELNECFNLPRTKDLRQYFISLLLRNTSAFKTAVAGSGI